MRFSKGKQKKIMAIRRRTNPATNPKAVYWGRFRCTARMITNAKAETPQWKRSNLSNE